MNVFVFVVKKNSLGKGSPRWQESIPSFHRIPHHQPVEPLPEQPSQWGDTSNTSFWNGDIIYICIELKAAPEHMYNSGKTERKCVCLFRFSPFCQIILWSSPLQKHWQDVLIEWGECRRLKHQQFTNGTRHSDNEMWRQWKSSNHR